MVEILFEWLEFAFDHFKSRSNGLNLHLNGYNPFLMVRISIRMVRITFELLEFAFDCFKSRSLESLSNG